MYVKQNSKYFMVEAVLRNKATSFKKSNFENRLENIVFLELFICP